MKMSIIFVFSFLCCGRFLFGQTSEIAFSFGDFPTPNVGALDDPYDCAVVFQDVPENSEAGEPEQFTVFVSDNKMEVGYRLDSFPPTQAPLDFPGRLHVFENVLPDSNSNGVVHWAFQHEFTGFLTGIAADPSKPNGQNDQSSGQLYVAETKPSGDSVLKVFDFAGTILMEIDLTEEGLRWVRGVDVDHQGNVYVTHRPQRVENQSPWNPPFEQRVIKWNASHFLPNNFGFSLIQPADQVFGTTLLSQGGADSEFYFPGSQHGLRLGITDVSVDQDLNVHTSCHFSQDVDPRHIVFDPQGIEILNVAIGGHTRMGIDARSSGTWMTYDFDNGISTASQFPLYGPAVPIEVVSLQGLEGAIGCETYSWFDGPQNGFSVNLLSRLFVCDIGAKAIGVYSF